MTIEGDSVNEIYEKMSGKLKGVVPPFELKIKAELVFEINKFKKKRGAVILGHNYMEPALYASVPDIVGDSLQLSREAARTDKSPIVFCGVKFMAETAKILNPDKLVLLPAKVAGCSLAQSITAEDVRGLKKMYPGAPVVTYVNTYADVKAESDICCTSGNASKVVLSLNTDRVIFIPDEYLAGNVANETGIELIFPTRDPGKLPTNGVNKVLIGWPGRCEVHDQFTLEDIRNARKQFPGVVILSHPECSPEVAAASDFCGSTSKMIEYVRDTKAPNYMLLTECSMADNIISENPDKEMVRICSIRCPHMNEITLEDTLNALKFDQYKIEVPEEIRVRAKRALDRMLEIG